MGAQKKTELRSSDEQVSTAKEAGSFSSKWVYLYLLKHTGDPAERVKAYVVQMTADATPNQLQAEVQKILDNIAPRDPCGWQLGDVKWRRRSYIVIVLDDSSKFEPSAPVTITPADGGTWNHTFDHGEILSFAVAGRQRQGYYLINEAKKKGGGDMDEEAEMFRLKVNHPKPSTKRAAKIRSHEDSGTNMGPPIQP